MMAATRRLGRGFSVDNVDINCLCRLADLLVRGLDDNLDHALKKRAWANGCSAEAEHRPVLASALMGPFRRKLSELLATMSDVGLDYDFERQGVTETAADVFDGYKFD